MREKSSRGNFPEVGVGGGGGRESCRERKTRADVLGTVARRRCRKLEVGSSKVGEYKEEEASIVVGAPRAESRGKKNDPLI